MSPADAAVRPRAKRGDGELVRDEILAAAEALLVETGAEDAVSIRAVADAVGVTAPTIYRHFSDKATLIFEVCVRQFNRLHDHLQAVRAEHDDPVDAVRACGRAYVQFGLDHPEHYRVMFMAHHDLTPEQYRDHVLAEHGAFQGLVEAVQQCVDAGRITLDAFTASTILWATVHGATSLRISKPNFPWPDLEEQFDTVFASLERGIFVD